MFRKVKWTFIGITMALLAVVLVVVLLIFNIASYNGQLEGIKTSLTMALDRGPGGMGLPSIGGFSFEQDEDFVVHGLAGSDDAFEADTDADAAAAAGGDDADDAAASGGYVAAGERTTRIAVGDGGMPAPPEGAEPGGMERSSVPVYCVTVDEQLTVLSSNGTAYMEQTVLVQAISLASASPVEFGELGDLSLFYAVRETHDGMRIAFASSSDLHAQAADRALGSALIGACVLAVLFAISYFLARFAMRPVEEAWAGQRRFIADASHELKTPLTVILANTDIVCSDPESTVGEQERWLEGTREEAKKMQGLVQDLLTLAQTEPDAVQGVFTPEGGVSFDLSPIKKGEIAPSDSAPVLMPLPDLSGYRAVPMRWGFPKYGNEKGVIFNARSEPAGSLAPFRRSLRERRIAVPSTGFYEWDKLGGTRRRFLFRPAGETMTYMAGIFKGIRGGEEVRKAAGGSADKDRRSRRFLPYIYDQGSDREVLGGCI